MLQARASQGQMHRCFVAEHLLSHLPAARTVLVRAEPASGAVSLTPPANRPTPPANRPTPPKQPQAAKVPEAAKKKPAPAAAKKGEALEQEWLQLQAAQKSGAPVTCTIQSVGEKGVTVQVGSHKGFVPYNGLDAERLRAGSGSGLDFLIGQPLKAKIAVAEVREGRKQLILSERRAQQSDALKAIAVGSTVTGTVTGIEDFGALVKLSGTDITGLVRADEVTWAKIMTVDAALSLGQEVRALVVSVDTAQVKLGLSLKRLTPDPLAAHIDDEAAWGPCVHSEPPQVSSIISKLTNTPGVTAAIPTRQLLDTSHVAQELEVYLTRKAAADGPMTLIARVGTLSTELTLETTLSREEVKALVQRLVR